MKKILLGLLSTVLSSSVLLWNAQPDGLLHIYFLNVGQGDAILLRTPSGINILVDGGPKQNVIRELNDVLPFFDRTLDYILLTHPDQDHIEGLISVLQKYPVEKVLFTGSAKKSYFYDRFIELIAEKNIPVIIADQNSDIILADGVFLDILFPFSQIVGRSLDTNNISLMAKVIYGTNEILLTGDAETAEEIEILNGHVNIDSDILKVAHHGSNTSTTEEFLKAVSPEYSVISVGKNNKHHHPHPSILKRLKQFNTKILRTDRDGRIEFVMTKEGILSPLP